MCACVCMCVCVCVCVRVCSLSLSLSLSLCLSLSLFKYWRRICLRRPSMRWTIARFFGSLYCSCCVYRIGLHIPPAKNAKVKVIGCIRSIWKVTSPLDIRFNAEQKVAKLLLRILTRAIPLAKYIFPETESIGWLIFISFVWQPLPALIISVLHLCNIIEMDTVRLKNKERRRYVYMIYCYVHVRHTVSKTDWRFAIANQIQF